VPEVGKQTEWDDFLNGNPQKQNGAETLQSHVRFILTTYLANEVGFCSVDLSPADLSGRAV
jgi:hypothetical protein